MTVFRKTPGPLRIWAQSSGKSGNEDEGRRLLQSALALRADYTWAQLRLAQLYLVSNAGKMRAFGFRKA